MAGDPAVLGALGSAGGLAAFLAGFRKLKTLRRIENTPTSTVRSMPMGLVELRGAARSDEPHMAPFSEKPVAFYRVRVEQYRRRGRSSRWVTIHDAISSEPFWLEDETGRVLVLPNGAELHLPSDYHRRFNGSRLPAHLESYLDVLLKQRHDEIPKLVKTVEAYMAHERGTLERVIQARNALAQARTVGDAARADSDLHRALERLFALAESYPDLKANSTFLHLQERISSLEDQIADRREFYNHAVNRFNVRIEQIPDLFIARQLGYHDKEYFRATDEDRQDVEIRFSNSRA